jgi:hypothetical protein
MKQENISVGKWEDLQQVHLIVVCVDSQDSKPVAEKLVKEVKHLPQVPIFSLQKGVKNGSAIKEAYVLLLTLFALQPVTVDDQHGMWGDVRLQDGI